MLDGGLSLDLNFGAFAAQLLDRLLGNTGTTTQVQPTKAGETMKSSEPMIADPDSPLQIQNLEDRQTSESLKALVRETGWTSILIEHTELPEMTASALASSSLAMSRASVSVGSAAISGRELAVGAFLRTRGARGPCWDVW